MTRVAVIQTGVANTASVIAALKRCGAAPALTRTPDTIADAEAVVLPGVGAFGAAMRTLEDSGLADPIRWRISEGLPTLCICLGMQVLFDASDEAPGLPGLGIAAGRFERFPDEAGSVPHLGWNDISPDEACRVLSAGAVYFANSYRLVEPPPGWSAAYCEYGGRFVAAVERQGVVACQFHPELSGTTGSRILTNWLAMIGAPAC
ncbi:MAG: imidazole glycerol phosphate synthase subunit HisH [Planctomycetota bacterium]